MKRIILVGAVLAAAAAAARPADDKGQRLQMTAEERQLLELTNAERAKEKLPPLAPNATLFRVARAHSANMARKQDMNHVLDGKDPARRVREARYDYKTVGENIAEMEFGKPADAQPPLPPPILDKEIVQKWMASPEHRHNILNPEFEEIGLGVGRTDKGLVYFTQVLATRRKNPG
jgi:uncharacterized protein YkwD